MNGGVGVANFAERMIPILLLAYPILLLSVRNGMSTCFALLLVASLIYLFQVRWTNIIVWRQGDIAFAVAMACLFGFTLVSQAYDRSFRLDSLDSPSRFFLVIPIYLMLRSTPLSFLRLLDYGFPLGVLAGFFTSIFFHGPHDVFSGTYFVDAPMWGGAMLTLAFLSVSTINWTRKDPPAVFSLKLASFFVGIYGAVKTGERGIWIAIPILVILWAHYRFPLKYRAAIGAIAIIVAVAGYWIIPTIPQRIVVTQIQIEQTLSGDFNSSMGLRLQIWNAAVKALREHPIAGVGPEGAPNELQELGLGQIHNEILANTVRLGVFGLLSILAIYFVPMVLFVQAARSVDRVKHMAGVMGILFVTGYFIFGLTIETFNLKMFATFYAVTVTTLLAIVSHTASQRAPFAAIQQPTEVSDESALHYRSP
jgi:O-antigen ligase